MSRLLIAVLQILVIPCALAFSFEGPSAEFDLLFNGVDLKGWYGLEQIDPLVLAKLSPAERAAKHKHNQEELRKHWSVENGEIVNDGQGPYLTTDQEYGDIELLLEYKTVPLADSGIYLRGTPQVQIWDSTESGPSLHRGADKGSGALWNNGDNAAGKFPLVHADLPFGKWNKLRILQVGARVSVWLNDKLVVNHAIMQNFWNQKRPLITSGPIQLQTHGGEIRWRNLKIREIDPTEANQLLSSMGTDHFVSIIDGKDLKGWAGDTDAYTVRDGALWCKPGKSGTVYTEEEYGDFIVRLEFVLPEAGNNGLAIRYPGEGDAAYAGMCELQVLDNTAPTYADLDSRQFHGSAYGMKAAHQGFLRPIGTWNFQEVTVKGSNIKVELNGYMILDADLDDVTEYLADAPHPGKELRKGHFGFTGHSDQVGFRNVSIRELAPEP